MTFVDLQISRKKEKEFIGEFPSRRKLPEHRREQGKMTGARNKPKAGAMHISVLTSTNEKKKSSMISGYNLD